MDGMFATNESRLSLKRAFEGRVWQTAESFQNYMHEKIILANKLDLDEEEVLENLIEGIPDPGLKTQARIQCFTTKQQLADAFRQIELPKAKVLSSRMSAPANAGPSTSRQVAVPGKVDIKTIRCYNCNSLGHYAYECRKERRQYGACHVCSQFGHRAAECPGRKAVVLHAINKDEEDEYEHY
ncbi:uncharacterized protein LOC129943036 [Eupeodes corollae]|uniref:uncharacterized protein LOC129938750 n=1 Tax=Eupeodes corollae TaxID=290404 RepID=UPI0024914A16|nr:uncharacterized protein LOC129938750 [Eupeodes corollae]XP_055907820.1 uncharacterized protein LOC129942776 [Eupeodes corollae]XP_055908217.1 uncharacterized protein LOC129943036 [Eupeodes corollae]